MGEMELELIEVCQQYLLEMPGARTETIVDKCAGVAVGGPGGVGVLASAAAIRGAMRYAKSAGAGPLTFAGRASVLALGTALYKEVACSGHRPNPGCFFQKIQEF